MLEFKIYDITDTGVEYNSTVEIEPNSSKYVDEIKYLFKLQKNKKVYVQPFDAAGVHFLTKPKPRGRTPVPDDIVVFMHEQLVEHKMSPMKILYEIYKQFNVELNMNMLNDILSQKKYVDVPGAEHLRDKAEAMMPKKPDRKRKITDSMKQEWVHHLNEGMSGNAISKLYDVSSVSVNKYFKDNGYRKKINNKNT